MVWLSGLLGFLVLSGLVNALSFGILFQVVFVTLFAILGAGIVTLYVLAVRP